MPSVECNGLVYAYDIHGDASSPVVVLSHSLGVDRSMWHPQVAFLADRFRLLTYDTRGHGASSVPAGAYSIAQLGQDVLTLLDTLGIQRASFCGLSMGGLIGQWLSLHAAGRLQKLVLANTAAKIGTSDAWNARIANVSADGLANMIPGTLDRWFAPDFRTRQSDVVARTAAKLAQTQVQGYLGCCAAVRDADFRDEISAIRTPTLVISGTYDPVTTPEDGRFLAKGISGAGYVELPAAHLSNLGAETAFNRAIAGFLSA